MLFAALALLWWPAPAGAQYFDRNKVQYDKFDFDVLQTEHFDVHYYPREQIAAEAAAALRVTRGGPSRSGIRSLAPPCCPAAPLPAAPLSVYPA